MDPLCLLWILTLPFSVLTQPWWNREVQLWAMVQAGTAPLPLSNDSIVFPLFFSTNASTVFPSLPHENTEAVYNIISLLLPGSLCFFVHFNYSSSFQPPCISLVMILNQRVDLLQEQMNLMSQILSTSCIQPLSGICITSNLYSNLSRAANLSRE